MVNTLSGSVCAYRKETVKPRFIRIDEVMALLDVTQDEANPIRLYSLDEITEIFCKLGLRICNSFADFSGKPSSDNDIQLMVYSIRE